MKNLILITLFISSSLFADCYREITLNATRSSRLFYLAPNEIEEYEILNEQRALEVISVLLQRETSCDLSDVINRENPASCYRLRTGITCEVLTSIGYFIIHRSAYGVFDHSIIYTRWD